MNAPYDVVNWKTGEVIIKHGESLTPNLIKPLHKLVHSPIQPIAEWAVDYHNNLVSVYNAVIELFPDEFHALYPNWNTYS